MMQSTVDPIDEKIGEHDEQRKLKVVVPQSRPVFSPVVHLGIPSYLCQKERSREQSHSREGHACLLHLHGYLILEIFWMIECVFVKDEYI
jgi:hypothetical protein